MLLVVTLAVHYYILFIGSISSTFVYYVVCTFHFILYEEHLETLNPGSQSRDLDFSAGGLLHPIMLCVSVYENKRVYIYIYIYLLLSLLLLLLLSLICIVIINHITTSFYYIILIIIIIIVIVISYSYSYY